VKRTTTTSEKSRHRHAQNAAGPGVDSFDSFTSVIRWVSITAKMMSTRMPPT
jgi:hypothetical protein